MRCLILLALACMAVAAPQTRPAERPINIQIKPVWTHPIFELDAIDTDSNSDFDTDSDTDSDTDFDTDSYRYKREDEQGTDEHSALKPLSHFVAILLKKRQKAYLHQQENDDDCEDCTTTDSPMSEEDSLEQTVGPVVPPSFYQPQIEERPRPQVEEQPVSQMDEESSSDQEKHFIYKRQSDYNEYNQPKLEGYYNEETGFYDEQYFRETPYEPKVPESSDTGSDGLFEDYSYENPGLEG